MSRGGKEGNNAFTKDQGSMIEHSECDVSREKVMKWQLSCKFVNELIRKKHVSKDNFMEHGIGHAVRYHNIVDDLY